MNRPRLFAQIAAMAVALASLGCRGGQLRGSGTACSQDAPCRLGFVCQDGRCQPLSSTDQKDAAPEALVTMDTAMTEAPPDVPSAVIEAPDGKPEASGPPDEAGPELADSGINDQASGEVNASPIYPPRPCDRTRPFEKPTLVPGLASRQGLHDDTGRLSADERTIYFLSNRSGLYTLHTATRSERGGSFSSPVLIANLIGNDNDGCPTVPSDHLTLYFDSDRTGHFALFKSVRSAVDQLWGDPTQLFSVSPPDSVIGDGGPSISPDGKVLYFHSIRSGNLDIFRTQRADDSGNFGPAFAVTNLATVFDETRPVVSRDELTIFYASGRPDGNARGGWDIWTATRLSKDLPFSNAVNVAELNSPVTESPTWLSDDQCELYLSQDGAQGSRIFVARRPMSVDAGASLP